MTRRLLLFMGVLALSFGAVVVFANWRPTIDSASRSDDTPALKPGERTTTADGRMSFTAPAGWTTRPCPPREDPACAQVSPKGGGEGDVVMLMITAPNPVEGSPMDLFLVDDPVIVPSDPAVQRFTLDGAKAVRLDSYKLPPEPMASMDEMPGVSDVMVFGVVPDATDEFMIMCRNGVLPAAQMRAGCDLIVESLRFPR
ncbi:hypothetical protein AB0B97_28040 [Micromonospora sp. NPDC049004]|uniref:hypothetical protein n=1 Tax=Micromonospora sp. NPDC049004 TaxID=3154348 RepID=UPI0033BFD24A